MVILLYIHTGGDLSSSTCNTSWQQDCPFFCTTTLPSSNMLEKKGLALEAPVLVEPTVFESRASTCPEFANVGGDGGCHLILIPRAMMLADSPVIGVLLIYSLPSNLVVEGMIGPGAG